jgi:hypothetical protein
MAESQARFTPVVNQLAGLILEVARESVSVVKRNAPEQALGLTRKQEWGIYLEFLKVLFNLVDRLSALSLPVQEHPAFTDSLENALIAQLKSALGQVLGPDQDDMEITLTIGRAVDESRQAYDGYRFVPTEDSKEKEAYFRSFGQRVARRMQAAENAMIETAASLCASAAVPAIKGVLQGILPPDSLAPPRHDAEAGAGERPGAATVPPKDEITLISVRSFVQGEEIETRWGLHPQFRRDLKPEESQELTRLMNRVTRILGERYATVAFSPDWLGWHRVGHA